MQTAADQLAGLTKDLEAQLANFEKGPAALEQFDGGRCCAVMFHWLEEASTIAEAKAIARCHGFQLLVQTGGSDAFLPDELLAEYEQGGNIFDRWNPEPPEPGLIFAGKHDTEDGDLLVKWLRPLSLEEREQWRAFLQVSLNFSGTRRIALERHRQIMSEHYTPEHDVEHTDGSIALAGGLLALRAAAETMLAGKGDTDTEKARALLAVINYFWPWDQASLKPKPPMRDLERAGALIAAEVDRRVLHAEVVEEIAAETLANAVRQQTANGEA